MPTDQEYAGQRLGLPREGAGSVAGWGRRILALLTDLVASGLVAQLIARAVSWDSTLEAQLPTIVFFLEVSLFTALLGGSFAQLALRIGVVRLDGKRMGLLRPLLRTLLICLIVPPLIFNRDNRGLHDIAVNTITVNR
jgi:uncharacterized RDD family membrane protein YckC